MKISGDTDLFKQSSLVGCYATLSCEVLCYNYVVLAKPMITSRQLVSNLVLYAQSTITIISGGISDNTTREPVWPSGKALGW